MFKSKFYVMKKLINILHRGLYLTCFLIFFSCNGDDETATDDPGDPNDFCNIEACSSNPTFKSVCIDEYNDCVALGIKTKTECAAFAAETCTY